MCFVEDTLKDGILRGPLHITLRKNIISLQLRVSHPLLEGHLKKLTGIFRGVFLNRRAAARYRALASIIPVRERPEETTICYKISLVQVITNLN